VSWLRWLVAGEARLSPCGFVVDRVALGQASLRVLRFYPVSTIVLLLSVLMRQLGDEKRPVSGGSSETLSRPVDTAVA
jgi:hypothetical protein